MKRYKHSLSNYHMVSCDMGQLIPVNLLEVLPGDTFQQSTSVLLRVSPLLAPVFHPIQVRIHHWFVPNRIIWDGWENFITGDPASTGVPQISSSVSVGSLSDYFGIPNVIVSSVNALPIRAYNLIFNQWYRDQDLTTEVVEGSMVVQNVAWGKDYFTTARPWALKGDPVTLPLGTSAPVTGIGVHASSTYPTVSAGVDETDGTASETYAKSVDSTLAASNNIYVEEDPLNTGFPNIRADLSGATATDINTVRRAFALQRYQEARARYGSRYTEYLRYLGVHSSDARLQRPEYLGGGKATIQFSEVLQTAEGVEPVGTFTGHGIAGVRTRRYRRYFEEHGHVISLLSVRPKGIYETGVPRKFIHRFKEDFYQKELESIGQQEILSRELVAANDPGGSVVFGYADRYREYPEEASCVTSEFRTILDHWHLARKFGAAPTLNDAFIKCIPTKRIHADQTQDVLWCNVTNSVQARRMVNRGANARIV